jgi:hypothetical protein
MSIPGFRAESSLEPTIGKYQSKAIFNRSTTAALSMQQFSAPFSGHGGFGQIMRCCGYDPLVHRYVCVTRDVSPIENCRCIHSVVGPVIVCRGPIVSSD